MDWDKVGNPVHEHYRKVLKARNEYSKVLKELENASGSPQPGYPLIFEEDGEEVAIVGLNTKMKPKT